MIGNVRVWTDLMAQLGIENVLEGDVLNWEQQARLM
jgi:hypothetical protein